MSDDLWMGKDQIPSDKLYFELIRRRKAGDGTALLIVPLLDEFGTFSWPLDHLITEIEKKRVELGLPLAGRPEPPKFVLKPRPRLA